MGRVPSGRLGGPARGGRLPERLRGARAQTAGLRPGGPARGHALQFQGSKRFDHSVRKEEQLARKREPGPASKDDRKAAAAPKTERPAAAAPAPAPEAPVTLARLRHYRKLTKAVAGHLGEQLQSLLGTLGPLFHAETVFGDYVLRSMLAAKAEVSDTPRAQLSPDRWGRGSELNVKREAAAPPTARELDEAKRYAKSVAIKEAVKGSDRAFQELEDLYGKVARRRPYDLGIGLTPPLPINTSALEILPFDYPHVIKTEKQTKKVMVTAPLTWIVSYAGFPLARLRSLVADPNRSREDLQRVLTHYLLLHVVLDRKEGLRTLLSALNFEVRTETVPEFGDLPLTIVTSAVRTERPPDDVILESTDLSGVNATEEIVTVTNVAVLADARRARLLEILESEAAGGDA